MNNSKYNPLPPDFLVKVNGNDVELTDMAVSQLLELEEELRVQEANMLMQQKVGVTRESDFKHHLVQIIERRMLSIWQMTSAAAREAVIHRKANENRN